MRKIFMLVLGVFLSVGLFIPFATSGETVIVDGFEGDISLWSTNASDEHVEYNVIEKSKDFTHEGKYSLKWKCKSPLWNNIRRDLSDVDSADVKQIEFWIYLPKLPAEESTHSRTISVEIQDNSGHLFGYWEKMVLSESEKWVGYVFNTSDLQAHVGNPDAKIDLSGMKLFQFNYTGGEFEAYIDGIQFRK